jgi:6-pyruvoyltetrahydropterin/6-carboxytetrahydropterin synthase
MDVKLKGDIAAGGMLLDYYDIHQIVKPIIEEMDHGFMVQKSDSVILEFLQTNNFKHFVIEKAPTAENITEILLERLAPAFRKYSNLTALKIRIYETEDTYAEAEIKL